MKKIYYILLVLIFTLGSCWTEDEKAKVYYNTWIVFTWGINESNTYIWYLEWENTTNLSTKVWWKVTNIFVEEWDYINKWELLLKLDSKEAIVWYNASNNVISNLYNMKNQTSLMFDSQINIMEEKIQQTKLAKEWLLEWLNDTVLITDTQLQTAKVWVETAEIALTNTIEILETKESNIYNNSKDAIATSVILNTSIINFVDELLWITDDNKSINDDFEDYLSVKNKQKLIEARNQFKITNNLYLDYKSDYDSKIENKNPNNEVILKVLDKGIILSENVKSLLNVTYDVLSNSVSNIYLTKESLDSYKNNLTIFWNNIESSLITVSWEYFLWLKWSKQSLANFWNEKNMQINLLEKQLDLANKTYNQYKATTDAKIREVTVNSKVSDSQYNEILSGLTSLRKQKQVAISELDSKINEAIWNKNLSMEMINSWEINSSISWVVISKNIEIWEVVWWWIPLLIIADNKILKTEILVWEDIFQNIWINDEVLLEVDWFDTQFKWLISKIQPTKDIVTKKYKIEISIINDKNIKIGSYVKVYLSWISNHDNLLIPNSAIISKFMIPWVYVIEDDVVVFKNIKILYSGDTFSHIEWLNQWDIIITSGKENLFDWQKIK